MTKGSQQSMVMIEVSISQPFSPEASAAGTLNPKP